MVTRGPLLNDKLFFPFLLHPKVTSHWPLECVQICATKYGTKGQQVLLIHSANPKSRHVGIIVFTHVVRPFQIKKNKATENNIRYWRDYGSGRVDHWWHQSCLVYFCWTYCYEWLDEMTVIQYVANCITSNLVLYIYSLHKKACLSR